MQAVIDDLRSRPAVGTFGNAVEAWRVWDDYCWNWQEGPFDGDMGWDDVRPVVEVTKRLKPLVSSVSS